MGISLQKIHVNPTAPIHDINVATVVCHQHNGPICFSENTISHQYVIYFHIIFEHLTNPSDPMPLFSKTEPTAHTTHNSKHSHLPDLNPHDLYIGAC